MIRHLRTVFWLSLSLTVLVACGDDGDDGGIDIDAGEQPGPDSAPTPVEGPLYAVTTQVFGASPADTQSYVIVTDELEGNTELSLDDAIEVPGRALGVGPEDGDVVFVGGTAAPTVTRYDLSADGTLAEGETVSFQGKGLATIGEYGGQFQFISDTKAYFFDGATAQAVIWNPQDMSITGDIQLGDLVLADSTLTFTAAPLRIGDDIITFASWRKGLEVPSQTAVVVIDTTTDQATVAIDTRCGYVRDGIEGDDGMIYLATEAFGSAVYRLNEANAPAPCLLRFDPESGEFDAEFHVELGTLAEGATVGSLVRGPDGSAFVRVLDEDEFAIQPDTNPRVLASAQAWRWARLTLGDEPTITELDADANNGSVIMAELGARNFAFLFDGQSATSFLELSSDGPGAISTKTTGLVFSAVKMR
ncbi:hypothetical protein [Haliangium ochraceum]|uniref:Lipoprotein n=1 Tax=Haliangium ochraceum (strain DSM 14365 / JCM 11303 / SMP-2) TaxID=502025 RepID=D0LFX0_HALO1|nr:hypothetical protein [Haliangium ochraceum]ACY14572.1 conserved hypothetical protein [Haliangium ochraceum DSM 14365]